ncbi:MAG TPA: hypothetical protein VKI17_00140, partial [Gemmataceae bacterium]|nr:hypothetical protein [Gemmataceae bacterium]
MKLLMALALFTCLATTLVVSRACTADAADAGLTAFFQKYLDQQFRLRPLDGTRLGDHRFDHLLEDLSPEARKAWVELSRRTLQELGMEFDYQKLPRAAQI